MAFFALAKERGSVFIRRIIPNLGAATNIAMLIAVIWLGILGGGMTQWAAFVAIAGTVVWAIVGVTLLRDKLENSTFRSITLSWQGTKRKIGEMKIGEDLAVYVGAGYYSIRSWTLADIPWEQEN